MAEQLSTEQVLLLNNLMYMDNDSPLENIVETKCITVEELISTIEIDQLEPNKDYHSFMTGEDWKNIINTIKQDEQLLNMKIVSTHIDDGPDGGKGGSAVFVDPSTNEAVVTFRGTANGEWKDNFIGGGRTNGLDGVSTLQQENALEWYRSLNLDQYDTVTVTGHSKGGNKAKYITVMDETVDRCLSFDGQGFSDEFIKHYQNEIAAHQDKIFNNNVDSDYVNLLLNDIGNTTFYKGYDYGEGGFIENHCPNTFLNFKSDGTVEMAISTRDGRMAIVDEFLNNYLRTLSPEDKQKTLAMIGNLVEEGFKSSDPNKLLQILLKDKNVDYAANLAAYLLEYKKEHPELVESLNDILNGMGMDNVTTIIDTIDDITDSFWFDKIIDVLSWGLDHQFVYDKIKELLKEKGISLTDEEIKKLIGMLQTMKKDMDDIEIKDNGKDLVASPTSSIFTKSRPCSFEVQVEQLRDRKSELENGYIKLIEYLEEITNIRKSINDNCFDLKLQLITIEAKISQEIKGCKHMKQVLGHVEYNYQISEQRLIENAHI